MIIKMENILRRLFDYQRFEQNERLAALINDTQARCAAELDDDALENIAAAGDFHSMDLTDEKDRREKDGGLNNWQNATENQE